jgi:uncharacterized peroxidase-related enzyme
MGSPLWADGLPRAERELATVATSRYSGCIYCASVHARFATTYSKRRDDAQRLLDAGVGADLGARCNAVVKASVALASTPIPFGKSTSKSCVASGSMTPKLST